ncbi:MAG: MFS transporter [Chloroflexi bacterium]|nr:MFS transporter [Chloroflexota bacterium]
MKILSMWRGRQPESLGMQETSRTTPNNSKVERSEAFQTNRIILISGGHLAHDSFSAFIAPLLPLLIDKLGLSLLLAGSLSVFSLMPSLLSPLIGYVADRFTIRYLVIFAPAATATLATLIGFMPNYSLAALLLFAMGLSVMSFHAPAPAMVAHIAGNKVGRGLSLFMAGGELGRTLAPLLVGFGVAQWGFEGLWRLMFFGWLASLILFIRLRDVSARSDRQMSKAKPLPSRIARVFAPLLGVMILRNLPVSSLTIFMVVYLVSVRGYDLLLASGALALYGLAGVAGALAGGTLSDRFGRRKTVALAALCSAVFMLVFVYIDGPLLLPILLGLGASSYSVTPVFQALAQDHLPDNRATASGIFFMYEYGVRAFNIMIVGVLGDALGLQMAFIVAALLSLLSLPLTLTLPAAPAVRHGER